MFRDSTLDQVIEEHTNYKSSQMRLKNISTRDS